MVGFALSRKLSIGEQENTTLVFFVYSIFYLTYHKDGDRVLDMCIVFLEGSQSIHCDVSYAQIQGSADGFMKRFRTVPMGLAVRMN